MHQAKEVANNASWRRHDTGMALKNRSVAADYILPHIVYQNLSEAIDWLSRVFGFTERYRYGDGPRGAQILAGRAAIQLQQAKGERSPTQLGYGTQSLTVFIDDVDGHYNRAKAAGAKILEEPHETVYGEYQYGVEDLDGHRWLFSRHARDVNPEEWGAVVTQ
jgi:uncharacterized glyoxalase superfamily protein PhnB